MLRRGNVDPVQNDETRGDESTAADAQETESAKHRRSDGAVDVVDPTPSRNSVVTPRFSGVPMLVPALVGIAMLLFAGLVAAWLLGDLVKTADRATARVSVPVGISLSSNGSAAVELAGCAGKVRTVSVYAVDDDSEIFSAAVEGATGDDDSNGLLSSGPAITRIPIGSDDIDGLLILTPSDGTKITGLLRVEVQTSRGAGGSLVAVPATPTPGVYSDESGVAVPVESFNKRACKELADG